MNKGLATRLDQLEAAIRAHGCDLCICHPPAIRVVYMNGREAGSASGPEVCPECGKLATALRVVYDAAPRGAVDAETGPVVSLVGDGEPIPNNLPAGSVLIIREQIVTAGPDGARKCKR